MLEWFPRLILLTVAVIVIALLVRYYTNRTVESAEVSVASHTYRIYYDDIIMKSDAATKRVYAGVVDVNRFTEERLNAVFGAHNQLGSCLTIKPAPGCGIAVEPICYNEDVYLRATAASGQSGGQGALQQTIIFPVTIEKDQERCPATLEIDVARFNT